MNTTRKQKQINTKPLKQIDKYFSDRYQGIKEIHGQVRFNSPRELDLTQFRGTIGF
jgi:hypothetical protein